MIMIDLKIELRINSKSLSVKQFLEDKRMTVLEHPPYSPDLASYIFCLFLRVKNASVGTHFQTVEEVKAKTADLLKMGTPNELQHCFESWKTRMQLCINRKEEYPCPPNDGPNTIVQIIQLFFLMAQIDKNSDIRNQRRPLDYTGVSMETWQKIGDKVKSRKIPRNNKIHLRGKVAGFDESRFPLHHADGRIRIWRKKHELTDRSSKMTALTGSGIRV
ncbi:uncharacterized protein TNCV_3476051 [Trichonephila clavipes]|nr:uncharacterized protein TNCV_3476051 [Trichonephila clavipes]